jgi:hypothetical protein
MPDQPRTYSVQVAAEIAEQYTHWTRIDTLEPDWFKVVLYDDGTAEVHLSIGRPPRPAFDEDRR